MSLRAHDARRLELSSEAAIFRPFFACEFHRTERAKPWRGVVLEPDIISISDDFAIQRMGVDEIFYSFMRTISFANEAPAA